MSEITVLQESIVTMSEAQRTLDDLIKEAIGGREESLLIVRLSILDASENAPRDTILRLAETLSVDMTKNIKQCQLMMDNIITENSR